MATVTVDEILPSGARIAGECDARFAGVLDAFRANFVDHGEVGAGVSLSHEGTRVVDLWGGVADPKTGRAWDKDTLCLVFSCTKGAAAFLVHRLVERGLIHLYAPVDAIWPAFAAGGKAGTTPAMMLTHTSPVPAFREPLRQGATIDWDYMVARLEAEEAWWEPGMRQGYHGSTFAWTVGQLVRIATGRTLGDLFREEIAEPLGLDFWIGLPEVEEPRVARLIMPAPSEMPTDTRFFAELMKPGSITNLLMTNGGGVNFNARELRAAEMCSANGVTNARALAAMYTPLANGGDGYLSADTIARASRCVAATQLDASMQRPARFGLGFMLSNLDPVTGTGALIGENAFGHVGSGGSIGFADPAARLGFGYVMNRGSAGGLLDARGQGLVDAAYRALGWSGSATGAWRP